MKRITKKKLKEIYFNNETRVAAKKLGVAEPTLLRYLREAKIPTKRELRMGNKKVVIID